MEKDNSIMKGQGEDGRWITVNGTHILVEKGQSVEDAVNTKFDKKAPVKGNETSNEVLSVSKALNKTGKATTQSKEVADMYKKNANPHWNYTVKEIPNGYEISADKKQESKVKTNEAVKPPKISVVNGYVIRKADNSNSYFVYNNQGHFEDDAHKGQGYSYEEALKRAIELPKGIATMDAMLDED